MDNDDALDLRHIIRLSDDDDNQELNENWKDYSSSSSAIALKEDAKEYLDGKAKRRLRRAQERKLNKHKKKTL